MAVFKDRTGDTYGRLTVLSHAGKNHMNKHLWLCLCVCGKQKVIVSCNLSSGKSNSCGCLKAEFLARKGNQFGLYEDREKALLRLQHSHLRSRDRKLGFNDTIDLDLFSTLAKSPCIYCGLEYSKAIGDRLTESATKQKMSAHVLKCNGIDRVDSSKGYTVENSVACCKFCNTAKHTMSLRDFYAWVKRVYEFNFQSSTGVAAAQMGRKFIGIEMDETYFDVSVKRIMEV